MGDSAGGGLALLLLQDLAKNNPSIMPKIGIFGSPWTDLAFTGESVIYNNDVDIILNNSSFNINKSRFNKEK